MSDQENPYVICTDYTPKDDPHWPACTRHPGDYTCNDRRQVMRDHADMIEPGIGFVIPIGLFYIGVTVEALSSDNTMGTIWVNNPNDDAPAWDTGRIWSEGDGRVDVYVAVRDWIYEQDHECDRQKHGIQEVRELFEGVSPYGTSAFKSMEVELGSRYCSVAFNLCLACRRKTVLGIRAAASTNVGMGGTAPNSGTGFRRGPSTGGAAASQRVKDSVDKVANNIVQGSIHIAPSTHSSPDMNSLREQFRRDMREIQREARGG